MTDAGDEDDAALATVLGERLASLGVVPDPRVEDLTRLSGGASRQTWSFRVATADGGSRRLVLRRDPPGEAGTSTLAREAIALRATSEHGVPGPDLLDASDDPAVLGAPYLVMGHVAGETIPRRILRDPDLAAARDGLAHQLGRALAQVHAVPAGAVPDLPVEDGLALVRDRYRATGIDRPVVDLALAWLEERRPAASGRALVHGDFRLGNVIVDPSGLRAVLDWELVHLGDPVEDLGYLCTRAWRFGGPRPVAGVGTFAQLFDGYASVAGTRPDPAAVRWWQGVGTLSWAVGCLHQVHRHLSGRTRSVELAAIGRRVAEQELDLLDLLDLIERDGGRLAAHHA